MDQGDQTQPGGQWFPPSPSPAYPPPKTSGMAIAAFVLALLGIPLCLPLIPALILGIIALVQINRNPRQASGQGFAIAALVISGIGVFLIPVVAAVLFPVFARARAAARTSSCVSNVKQLSVAVMMYAQDYEGQYPPPGSWDKATEPYTLSATKSGGPHIDVRHCPSSKLPGRSYAMNANLKSVNADKIANPMDAVMLFDASDGSPASGGPELMPSPPRHLGGDVVGFTDGHAKRVRAADYPTLVWHIGNTK